MNTLHTSNPAQGVDKNREMLLNRIVLLERQLAAANEREGELRGALRELLLRAEQLGADFNAKELLPCPVCARARAILNEGQKS